MSLVVPDLAEVVFLGKIFNEDVVLRLFANNVTPAANSLAADFTEVSGGGYAAKTLSTASWSFVSGNPSYALYAKQTWTFTGATGGAGTVYGYYVTRSSDGTLWWAERFAAAVVPFTPTVGSVVEVTPKFTGGSVY